PFLVVLEMERSAVAMKVINPERHTLRDEILIALADMMAERFLQTEFGLGGGALHGNGPPRDSDQPSTHSTTSVPAVHHDSTSKPLCEPQLQVFTRLSPLSGQVVL